MTSALEGGEGGSRKVDKSTDKLRDHVCMWQGGEGVKKIRNFHGRHWWKPPWRYFCNRLFTKLALRSPSNLLTVFRVSRQRWWRSIVFFLYWILIKSFVIVRCWQRYGNESWKESLSSVNGASKIPPMIQWSTISCGPSTPSALYSAVRL